MLDIHAGIPVLVPVVVHGAFSGILDMGTGDGTLLDMYGMSNILLIKHDDLLCFEKQYMEKDGVTPRGPIISYTLRKDPHTGVYVGTWERGKRENEGLAIMVLNPMPIPFASFVDYTYLLKKVEDISPESEILRRWHEAEQKNKERMRQSQKGAHPEPHPDWEIAGDVLTESDNAYGMEDSPDSTVRYSQHDGDEHDRDDLPF